MPLLNDALRTILNLNPNSTEIWLSKFNELDTLLEQLSETTRPPIKFRWTFQQTSPVHLKDITFRSNLIVTSLPRDKGHGIIFENCTFKGLQFADSFLNEGLIFKNCKFGTAPEFREVTVCKTLEFTQSHLHSLDFSSLKLLGDLRLINSRLQNESQWFSQFSGESIELQGCTFTDFWPNTFLKDARIKRLIIEGCTFYTRLSLPEASMRASTVRIYDSVFNEPVEVNLRFDGTGNFVSFENVNCPDLHFKKNIPDEINFKNNNIKNIALRNSVDRAHISFLDDRALSHKGDNVSLVISNVGKCNFDSEGVHFEDVYFSHAYLISLELKECKFSTFKYIGEGEVAGHFKSISCVFNKFIIRNITFKNQIKFENTTFNLAPQFYQSTFTHENVSFGNSIFRDFSSEFSKSSYSNLKFLCSSIHNDFESARFSSYEIESRGNELKYFSKDFFEKLFSLAYGQANDFGRTFWKPLIWILILIGIMSPVYTFNPELYQVISTEESKIGFSLKSASPALKGPYLSVVNSLGPIKYLSSSALINPASITGQALFFLQNLISSVLWFLFIIGLRKKFKAH